MDAHCLKPDELPCLDIERLGACSIDSPLIEAGSLDIERLGACSIDSPLVEAGSDFVDDEERIAVFSHSANIKAVETGGGAQPMFERAGPRRKIFFDPVGLNCGVVTCGGLCPGLNDVRSCGAQLRRRYVRWAVSGAQ